MRKPPEIPVRNNGRMMLPLEARYVQPGPGDHDHKITEGH
jgi:hypothetical protein